MIIMNLGNINKPTYENVSDICKPCKPSERLVIDTTNEIIYSDGFPKSLDDVMQARPPLSKPTLEGDASEDVHPKCSGKSIYMNIPLKINADVRQSNNNNNGNDNISDDALVDVEEMLSICVEYDKQNTPDNSLKMASALHITQNRIKTNGSLPRDNKFNVNCNDCNEERDLLSSKAVIRHLSLVDNASNPTDSSTRQRKHDSSSSYYNSHDNDNTRKYVPQSPRTKIRTCVTPNKTHEPDEYGNLIHAFEKKIKHEIKTLKENSSANESNALKQNSAEEKKSLLNDLCNRRSVALEDVRILKRKISELQCEEDEIFRDLDLEEALVTAELTTENIAIHHLEQDLSKVQTQIHRLEAQRNASRVMQETQQAKIKQSISYKQNQIESFHQFVKEDQTIQEELDRTLETLDNDKKMFEDLEFQYLEEESEWLSKREELLMRLKLIKRRILKMRSHTNGLQQQTFYYQQVACDDTKDLEQDLLLMIQELEQKREVLKEIDKQIVSLRNSQLSTENKEDVDFDKSNLLSLSLIGWNHSLINVTPRSDLMSRSLNENLLFSNIESSVDDSVPYATVNNLLELSSHDSHGNSSKNERICNYDEIPTRDTTSVNSQIPTNVTHGQLIKENRWSSPDMLSNENTAEIIIQHESSRQSRIPIYQSNNEMPRSTHDKLCNGHKIIRNSIISESDSIDRIISDAHKQAAKHQRPLTRYLPTTSFNFDLRYHIESAGHQIALCPYVFVDRCSCKGYLHKLGATFKGWSKRWFVLDRIQQAFVYYADKTEKRARGGAYFSAIEEVYLDHLNVSKSDRPNCTFVIKTKKRMYQLQAASSATARIWIDSIMTGALGNNDFGVNNTRRDTE